MLSMPPPKNRDWTVFVTLTVQYLPSPLALGSAPASPSWAGVKAT